MRKKLRIGNWSVTIGSEIRKVKKESNDQEIVEQEIGRTLITDK